MHQHSCISQIHSVRILPAIREHRHDSDDLDEPGSWAAQPFRRTISLLLVKDSYKALARGSLRSTMADEPRNPPQPEQENKPDLFEYTAFQHWEYRPIIHKSEHKQSWRSMTESFYRASEFLVKAVVERTARDDSEGVAAVFLFRHYLELALKGIIIQGRWIKPTGENATRKEVQKVKNIHEADGAMAVGVG